MCWCASWIQLAAACGLYAPTAKIVVVGEANTGKIHRIIYNKLVIPQPDMIPKVYETKTDPMAMLGKEHGQASSPHSLDNF